VSILARLDLASGAWTFDVQPEFPSPDIEVGFRNGDGPAVFDELTFGVTVTVAGQRKLDVIYPPAGVKYVATDQQWLTSDRVHLAADDVATLDVWAVNAGIRHEGSTTFTVPRPAQPYPSWVWDDARWQPPVPYPDEGDWEWDEATGDWVPYTGDE
jgi:hypothetical protein